MKIFSRGIGILMGLCALMQYAAAQVPPPYATVYATPGTIGCVSDATCAAIGNIQVQTVTYHGLQGQASYTWETTACTPDGVFYIQPTGATHCFVMTGFGSSSGGSFWQVSLASSLSTLTSAQAAILQRLEVGHAVSTSDFGGSPFEWKSGNQSANITADPYGCLWRAPSDDSTGASGAWRRNLSGITFNVDMCGAGSGASDVLPQIQAALSLCPSTNRTVLFPAETYHLADTTGLIFPEDCNIAGTYPNLTGSTDGTLLNFASNTTTGPLIYCGQPLNVAAYSTTCQVRNLYIGGTATASEGLYVSHASHNSIENIVIANVTGGAGFRLGFSLETYIQRVVVYGSGASGRCEIEFTGDDTVGTHTYSTTVTAVGLDAEQKSSANPDGGICVDATSNSTLITPISESAGINLIVLGKTNSVEGVNSLLIESPDFENPTGAYSVQIGTGWTGSRAGAVGVHIENGETGSNVSATSSWYITNSQNFLSDAVASTFGLSGVVYDFEGSNYDAEIRPPANSYLPVNYGDTWVKVGGVVSTAARPSMPWSMNGTGPATFYTNLTTGATPTLTPGTDASVQDFTAGPSSGGLALTFNAPTDTNAQPTFCVRNDTSPSQSLTAATPPLTVPHGTTACVQYNGGWKQISP